MIWQLVAPFEHAEIKSKHENRNVVDNLSTDMHDMHKYQWEVS
jgi:hypothetical protein